MTSIRPISGRRWIVPLAVGIAGLGLTLLAFWIVAEADDRRVRSVIELRSEWRTRDLEAKVRLAGNAVESIAIAAAVDPFLDPARFQRVAARARLGLGHVNALQWAPRVRRDRIGAFEETARAHGLFDYRVFDVDRDFRPAALVDRAEYFPILFEARESGPSRTVGLALGQFDGRRIPMEAARDEGSPRATLPVRPVGPPTSDLVFLLFWPVYDGIDVPDTVEERRARLQGYAVGNFNLAGLLTSAIRDTSEILGPVRFRITAPDGNAAAAAVAASYRPELGRVVPGASEATAAPAATVERAFAVFGQEWRLAFDFDEAAVAALRSNAAWGWLAAGLLLTASLVLYLLRERGRSEAIAALVDERTAELRATSEQLQQSQKMEAIGNLTGGMAHDFNNLLAIVIGNLDLLRDQVRNDPHAIALADAAMQASLRGAELTRQLLAFARRQRLEPKPTDINELVTGMTRLLQRILEGNIEVALVTAPDLWRATIDPAQLGAALTNLATNARDAMPNGGQLTIATKNAHLDADYASINPEVVPGDYVLLEVSDTGAGMSKDTLARAFEPFFTTKEVGRGTGLGLSMVFGFVRQSKGHLKIYSEVGQGTTVRLYLPRADAAAEAAPADTQARPLQPARHATVLVVEDNAEVRQVAARQLAGFGYTVIEAANGEAALKVIRDPSVAIDLLFTDMVMPGGVSGHDLAAAALAERPGLKVLLTSGYSSSSLRDGDRLDESEHFLVKPYRREELARKLREVLEA